MYSNRFKDQVAVVVGGARGIGLCTAQRLAKEGAKVVCLDVLTVALEQLTHDSVNEGLEIVTKTLDVRDETLVKNTLNAIEEEFGRVDIMVNCAGIIGETSVNVADTDDSSFEEVLQVNLVGAYYLTKYIIPIMLKNNYGRILHVSSIGGKEGNPGMAGYATSKAGLMGLVKAVGKEYAKTGITVNGLAPAVISTPMNAKTSKQMLDYMKAKIPMNRLGTVVEAAAIISWIVSPEASFNTGFIFDLSGGRATY